MSCGVGLRHSSDLVLLWLWYGPVAIALIQPLAWEPPHAAGVALKRPPPKKKMFQQTLPLKSNRLKPITVILFQLPVIGKACDTSLDRSERRSGGGLLGKLPNKTRLGRDVQIDVYNGGNSFVPRRAFLKIKLLSYPTVGWQDGFLVILGNLLN